MKSNGGYNKYVNCAELTTLTTFKGCHPLSDIWDISNDADWGYLFRYFVTELAAEDGGLATVDGGAEKALNPDLLAEWLTAVDRPGEKTAYGGGGGIKMIL